MSPDDDDLPTIDAASLENVTGGTSSNDDVTAALTSLSNDLKEFVSSQKNQGSNFFQQMLPFLLMMSGGGNWSFSSNGGFSCAGNGCHRCGSNPCRCH